ncbi:ketoacyl-ACP synthase III [Saccharibacillus kuerlensis]|uniref:Beta-ketoacyl-[acyl-carrier-protein] synthase III n=1 Tax=Saccharibacillus kuerlensis TaxID=459527 RepID=A0ABQ2KZ24_9BACL|nr:ketoacyl-ACP synthase III [Saccharibacillus kuerlensis]GGN97563.1 3-oxoacyl-[acyl-carrier-protein] synthase 3 protein 2 [Saccharibacillus kuerlensis]
MTQFHSTARITALGTYVPERKLTNHDLETLVDTNDEWIVQRTGIRERRIAADEEFTSDLCIKAVSDLQSRYPNALEGINLVLVATSTSDFPFPSVASLVQNAFNLQNVGALDLSAACSGFTYALQIANGMITSGMHRKVLIIAGECMSKTIDYTDRSTCILFGDGAGAAIVEYSEQGAFIGSYMGSDGSGGHHVYRTGISNTLNGLSLDGNGKVVQNGREVYKWAVRTVPDGVQQLCSNLPEGVEGINWFIPHSANLKMIDSISEKAGIPKERTLTSAEFYGNTSAASIPLALQLAIDEGKVKKGDLLLMYGFGAGLTHSGVLVHW